VHFPCPLGRSIHITRVSFASFSRISEVQGGAVLPRSQSAAPNAMEAIEPSEFDLVVLGTGLTESIVAA
jgi:hypothetical protein